MNRYIILLLCILTLVIQKGKAQGPDRPFGSVSLFTGRAMYVAGEKIMFSAVSDHSEANEPGNIFYCELVTPFGDRIAGGKYLMDGQHGHGCLEIPEATITGTYYLKTYTRVMRNGSPADYHFTMLKILHPKKEEVMVPGAHSQNGKSKLVKRNDGEGFEQADLLTDRSSYDPYENVVLRITGLSGESQGTYSLAAVPQTATGRYDVIAHSPAEALESIYYYPEGRGISLSGIVTDKITREPLAGIRVNLSLLGLGDVMAMMTDSSGRFFFALPDLHGRRDLFLSAAAPAERVVDLNIDNDFCTRPINLPSPEFDLDSLESETAYNMILNSQVEKAFYPDTSQRQEKEPHSDRAFYGKPSQVLLIDKYIELPTMQEYFNELPVSVKVRKSKGRKYFRFNSYEAEMTIYDPLVLIDWVAVEDMDKILNINPRDIERIELVNAPYLKGNVTYGGIVSFISRENDFAGIDLPKSGTFINYQFLEECIKNPLPDRLPDNLPDTRNTVYWNPDLQPDEKGEVTISFRAPHTPGSYAIILKELLTGREVIRYFTVR